MVISGSMRCEYHAMAIPYNTLIEHHIRTRVDSTKANSWSLTPEISP